MAQLVAPPVERRAFFRDTEANRRESLIAATQALVAEGGPQAATVRAIAARAGVTPGLIRHYFGSKDELIRAAYTMLVDGMTDKGADALEGVGADPEERLAAFVAASLRPPVVDGRTVGLWAGYLHQVQQDAGLLAQHEKGYLRYRDQLQALIADLGRAEVTATQLRQEAIACNAILDGLWLEGSVLPHGFAPGELVRIGLRATGAILGVNLTRHTTFIPELYPTAGKTET
ncbi:TetR family transcriptional regulator C-terminal domain-containing protein [Rhodobacter sp. Har01]|uniref:TetR/AcrR family transcriptional regulator n=1 Tax=Rhodobacter sp. Har01 TaxID=2883999 RepID=UPI001D07F84D|nr:TetR family transcriptional regulator C-terminal domain-containing protein [Rhodobacter sp. Har01]MCB6178453.1 TetR family transcriptional regulator C-terminal domain-containing protein [Rhodobacter sp. Har01]